MALNIYIYIRAVKFLITYWTIVFFVAVPYLIFFHKFEPKWIPINLFALLHDDEKLYVSLSWYIKVYLEFLIVLPIVKRLQPKVKSIEQDFFFFVLIPMLLSSIIPSYEDKYINLPLYLISSADLLFTWYPAFHMGLIAAKYDVANKLHEQKYGDGFFNKRTIISIISAFVMLLGILARNGYNDVFCAFVILISFEIFCKACSWKFIHSILAFLGKYSFQLWLLSGMFFLNTTEYQWVLFLPKYSALIFAWNFLILIPPAILMSKISGWLCRVTVDNLFRKRKEIAA